MGLAFRLFFDIISFLSWKLGSSWRALSSTLEPADTWQEYFYGFPLNGLGIQQFE